MNKIFKCLIRFLIEVIVMTVLIVGINIFMNGMYLWGLPRINDIQVLTPMRKGELGVENLRYTDDSHI